MGRGKSLREVQAAVGELSPEDRRALLSWMLEADRLSWDEQIARDFSAGGAGMKLLDEVDAQIESGNFKPLE